MIRRTFLALAMALAACSPSTGGGDSEPRVVNVYSARHYDTDQQLWDLFKERSGIEVRVLQSNADQLLERLRQEGDATQADLVMTVDGGALYRLAQAGVLQPVDTPALREAVPERMHDAENRWWAFSKRARVIVYRKDAVDPATLTSFNDLTQARFRGQVCARSSTNTYNLSLLAARVARDGAPAALAWARGVRSNFARDPEGGDTDQIRAVAAGTCQVAIVNHYYVVRLMESEDPADQAVAAAIGLVFPDQANGGTHVNVSGAGVATHAQHRDEAIALLEFLVSPEAQEMIAASNDEFPVRAGVTLPPALASLGAFTEESISLDTLGQHQAEAAQLFEQAGWR